MVLINYKI